VRLLFTFARQIVVTYWPWYLLGIVALMFTNWLTVTIPLYLAEAIDAVTSGPEGVKIAAANAGTIAAMGLAMMGVRTLSRVAFFTPGRLAESAAKRGLFTRILEQQPTFLRAWSAGDLVSRASSDVNSLRLLAGFGLLQAVNVVVVLAFTLTQMVRLSWVLTLWVSIPLAIGLLLTQVSIRWLFVLLRRLQEEIAKLSDAALSSYEGIPTVQAFVAEGAFEKRFQDIDRQYRRTTIQRAAIRSLVSPVLNLAALLDVFLLLWIGGGMVIEGAMTAGELVAFTSLVAVLASPLRGLGFLLAIIKQAQASLERIGEVVDPPVDRPDREAGPVLPGEAPPGLEIRDLTFCYPDAGSPALTGVSLQVPAGGTLGLFGATGSGKTTLVRCIARLYNPPPGTIFVDGVDVRHLDLEAWRRSAVLVPQRAFLFSETLKDNLLLGDDRPGRLEEALRLAALEQDVAALPQGVDSQVGEAGVMLSGGQRQRSALARGLLRDPRVLMLDDVLSAVDPETEARLITAIRERARRPTTVLVANRIGALLHADVIVVFDHGRVVDQGTHAELITRPGPYQETWLRQSEDRR
jgi:ATP-binding cassette subfamily B protein